MNPSDNDLQRFHRAQAGSFETAYQELQKGRKQSHWMWFIFPQIRGLGFSETSRRYAIHDLQEAEKYLQDPLLADRLIRLCSLLLGLEGKTAHEIFGSPDDLKLRSSMTLFSSVRHPDRCFSRSWTNISQGRKIQRRLNC